MSGWRFGCGKEITVYIPTKYSCREITAKCGSTSYNGGVNQCEECEEKHNVPLPYEDEGDLEWYDRTTNGEY
jgi:hypothetical protein